MTRSLRTFSLSLLGLAAACGAEPNREVEISGRPLITKPDLLIHWAPVHYQDVNKGGGNSDGGKSDYITRFDFDGDWVAFNNWDNMWGDMSAWCYTKVTDTPTHWYLQYLFFHPRDWARSGLEDEHENDLEGMLLVIRKDGTPFGHIEASLTQAHGPMIPFTADRSRVIPKNVPEVEGILTEARPGESWGRPRTYQEAEGHGMYMCGHRIKPFGQHIDITKCDKGDEDGIKYVVGGNEVPGNVGIWTPVQYRLRDLDDLWLKRSGSGPGWRSSDIYVDDKGMSFRGDETGGCGDGVPVCAVDGADAPWKWDGAGLTRPASYYASRFDFVGIAPPEDKYLKNDLLGCADMTSPGNRLTVQFSSCHAQCRDKIYAADPYCRDTDWDGVCAGEIVSVCGIQIAR